MKVLVWAWLLPILHIFCIGTANAHSQAGMSPVAACCNSCRLPFQEGRYQLALQVLQLDALSTSGSTPQCVLPHCMLF